METPEGNMSKVMHYINGSYTNYINRKHGRSGHLFQGRYKAILIERDSYLLELSRYVHLNPVRAKMVARPEEYPHSSYRSYIGRKKEEIVCRDLIWEMVSRDRNYAAKGYRDFVEKAIGDELESPLKKVYGGVILGGNLFIKDALARLKETVLQQEDISQRRELQSVWGAEDILETVSVHLKMSRRELLESKGESRNIVIYLLKKHTGLTNRQIGDLLGGVNYPAIGKAYQRFSVKLNRDRSLRKKVKRLTAKMSDVKT
jgi:hypothetical protein